MFLHAGFEGAKSGGLKTKLSDIIIAGLALIGSEGYIDIKHVIHVKHFDTDANLSQPWNDSCLTFTNTLCCMYEYMVLVDWQVRRLLSSYASLLFGILGACPVEKVGDIYFPDVDDNDDNVSGDNVDNADQINDTSNGFPHLTPKWY